MNVFISYASEDAKTAEEVRLAILGAGHQVFFDRNNLSPTNEYNVALREALRTVDVLVFLISPHSVEPGTYALTELKFAAERWPHPRDRVLPVLVAPTPFDTIPVYLRAVTLLSPQGNIAAEVAVAIDALRHGEAPRAEAGKLENEIVLLSDPKTAFSTVRTAMARLGSVRSSDETTRRIDGCVRFGLQSVRVRTSIAVEGSGRSRVVIQASSDDVWGAGAKSATKRLVEQLRNLDNPGYEPDRLGMHPAALVGLVLSFVIVLLAILLPIMIYVFPPVFDALGIH